MRVVVTGATGTVGRKVIDRLLTRGVDTRGITRTPEAARLPNGVEVLPGDLDRPETLTNALANADRMYLFPAPETARQVVTMAKQAGIRRIVVLSGATAADETKQTGEEFRTVERAVEESGLEWTHLRPGMFAGNTREWADSIRDEGLARVVYGEVAEPPIHEEDIADVAVEALLGNNHHGARYSLSGPESLNKFEQVRAIGRAIGREIRIEELSPEQWREAKAPYVSAEVIDWRLDYWAKALERPVQVFPTVEQVTGGRARGFAEWAASHTEDFR